jgi:hypothetical protein
MVPTFDLFQISSNRDLGSKAALDMQARRLVATDVCSPRGDPGTRFWGSWGSY